MISLSAFRQWVANALVELAILIEPKSKLEPVLKQLASEAREEWRARPEPLWGIQASMESLVAPANFRPIEERRFAVHDADGTFHLFSVTTKIASELRHIATDCEQGSVRGFRLTWMGPPHPMQAVTYPPAGDAKA